MVCDKYDTPTILVSFRNIFRIALVAESHKSEFEI